MFDKILLPVDPTKRLKPAREYAIALSEKLEVPLVAAFIANPKKAGTVTASLDTRDGFAALGKRQLDQIIESSKSIDIKPIIMNGKRHKVLAKMVDEGIADTLILGPFRSYWSRWFTGSEVERILEYESSHAFVVRNSHPLPGPGSPALVAIDGTNFSDKSIDCIESFAKKFGCDIELLYLGKNIIDTGFMDSTVVTLRERLGENYHITSTIIPHTFFKSRRAITNSVVDSEGARIVVLPVMNHLVSEFLLHQVVLDASVPVCVLR
tara:strand:+ start:52 stop:849 length:798 start_codon:yes stop_codon:yes gene_type:complete